MELPHIPDRIVLQPLVPVRRVIPKPEPKKALPWPPQ